MQPFSRPHRRYYVITDRVLPVCLHAGTFRQLLCPSEYMWIGKSAIGLDAQQSANIPFIIFITTIGYVQFIIPAFIVMHKSYSIRRKKNSTQTNLKYTIFFLYSHFLAFHFNSCKFLFIYYYYYYW